MRDAFIVIHYHRWYTYLRSRGAPTATWPEARGKALYGLRERGRGLRCVTVNIKKLPEQNFRAPNLCACFKHTQNKRREFGALNFCSEGIIYSRMWNKLPIHSSLNKRHFADLFQCSLRSDSAHYTAVPWQKEATLWNEFLSKWRKYVFLSDLSNIKS